MPRKQKKKNSFSQRYPFLALPAILIVILFVFVLLDIIFKSSILLNVTKSSSFNFAAKEYPAFDTSDPPFLTANGVAIMDSETKRILYGKNKNVRFSPASTTKIMTALTALEYYKLDDTLTVSDKNIDSVAGLRRREKFKFVDLLYAMMLPSDNRAAQTIADNYKGGSSEFVSEMNKNALRWNLFDTHFDDPVGLMDDSDYTTPFDLALLSSIAMQNETIKKIANTKNFTISDVDGKDNYDLENINELLGYDGIIGLKTGHTQEAGDVLVTAKNEQGHVLIIVVMNSENRFPDTLSLLAFIQQKITFLSIHP